ncbi:MAG: hypothetical protein ACFCU3_12470 [Verrucomicrobiales bacterium]
MAFSKDYATDILQRTWKRGRLAHAYLLCSPDQTVLMEVVRDVASSLLASPGRELVALKEGWPIVHPDCYTIEPESKLRRILLDQIHELEHHLRLSPGVAQCKLAILIEADRLQPQAANAFLKTLEEPPPHSFFFLLTSNPEAVLGTIRSRCLPVHIQASHGAEEVAPEFAELLEEQLQSMSLGIDQLRTALSLTRTLQTALTARRETLNHASEQQLKSEKAAWAETPEDSAFDEREAQLKAKVESEYLRYRETLLDHLGRQWALQLRSSFQQNGDNSQQESCLQLLEILEQLRERLARNVNEPLALEAAAVAWSRVLAPPSQN